MTWSAHTRPPSQPTVDPARLVLAVDATPGAPSAPMWDVGQPSPRFRAGRRRTCRPPHASGAGERLHGSASAPPGRGLRRGQDVVLPRGRGPCSRREGRPRALDVFFCHCCETASPWRRLGGSPLSRHVAYEALAATAPGLDPAARGRVVDAFTSLTAHGDARPALETLAAAAVPAVALTNGSAGTTEQLLRAAGHGEPLGRGISVDEVGVWKPAAAPYRHGAAVLRVEPGRLAIVAVHAWDVHGAMRAGPIGGWAARLEGYYPPTFDPPTCAALTSWMSLPACWRCPMTTRTRRG